MGEQNTEPAGGAVVEVAKRSHRKYILVLAIVLVLAAAGLFAWVYFGKDEDKKPTGNTPAQNDGRSRGVANDLKKQGDYEGEAAKISEYLATNPPEKEAQVEIIRLGFAYMNQKDYQKALETFQDALAKYKDAELAATRGIAFAYMKMGEAGQSKENYQKAIEWFEKAIEVAKRVGSDEVAFSDESNIRYIQGQMEQLP